MDNDEFKVYISPIFTGKLAFQLKQQEPHTYPLREVLRQQASPELIQALGCVGMRAS